MISKMKTPIVLIMSMLLLLSACNAATGTTEPTVDGGAAVDNTDATAEPVATATEEVLPTEEPDPAETPEVIDIIDPFPANNDEYFIAPIDATVEEDLNAGQGPGGYYWAMADVSMGNSAGETVTIAMEHISIIGDDGRRYPSYELVERVNPKLAGTELAESESVRGFALFALPQDVEPALFEWCVSGDCETPLQAPITLQDED